MAELTFLFTDVEGSTRLLRELGDRYRVVLAEHGQILQNAAAEHSGALHDTQGDSFFFSFANAEEALAAAAEAQRALDAHEWPEEHRLRVRMAVHSGEAELEDGHPVGLGVHRAARLCPLGHGGQVLVTDAARADAPGHSFKDLGPRKLKDFDAPVRVHQLLASDLRSDFPPLRPSEPPRRRWPFAVAAVLAAIAGTLAYFVARGHGSPVKVTPNSVAVIDARSGSLVDDIPVGQDPADVAYGGGAVWTTNAVDRTATHIDARTRKVVRTTALHSSEQHVAVAPGGIALFGGTPGITGLVGNDTLGEEVDQLGYAYDVTPPGPVAALRRGPLGRLRCAPNCWGTWDVAVGPLGPWTSGNLGTARIDVASRRGMQVTDEVAPFSARVAVGTHTVWVTEGETPGLGGTPGGIWTIVGTTVASAHSVRAPVDVATDGAHAWVAESGGSVAEIDAKARLVRRLKLSGPAVALAYGGGALWVALESGDLLRIDPAALRVVRTVHLKGNPTAVAVGAGHVWVAIA